MGGSDGKSKDNACSSGYHQRKRIFIEREDALQSSLKMGCFVMDRHHPDFLKARVMVTLFGGYFGSRLMSNIREDKGYTYGIGAGIVSYPEREY